MINKLCNLEGTQNEILGKLVYMYELLQEIQQAEVYEEDQIMNDENDEI